MSQLEHLVVIERAAQAVQGGVESTSARVSFQIGPEQVDDLLDRHAAAVEGSERHERLEQPERRRLCAALGRVSGVADRFTVYADLETSQSEHFQAPWPGTHQD